ncbi:MAG: hypothetical protein NWE93_02830 [Candidatus Bathyarchaeota archaeon]|nr:hypothetical protein [Candidatus Bathyarchaeota archaeon]
MEQSEDLLTNYDQWIGGIGRSHVDLGNFVERSYGLGDYQTYVRTPNYVDLVFADATLRVYKGQNFVETTQADRMQVEANTWDYPNYKGSTEQNIIDAANTNGPSNDRTWNIIYSSKTNPGWMAFRNSINGYILGGIGFKVDPTYQFHFAAKESHAFDRQIFFDHTNSQTQSPNNQPSSCKIYWYADTSNAYSNINTVAAILGKPPQVSVLQEEIIQSVPSPTIPEFPTITLIAGMMIACSASALMLKRRHNATLA